MRNANSIVKDEKGRRIIEIEGDSQGKLVLLDSKKYKYVFASGDELIPHPNGGWKLVDAESEIELPNGGDWKIKFSDGSKLFPIPYKDIISGEWVLLKGSGLLTGEIMVYTGGSLFMPGGFFKMKPKHEKNRRQAFEDLPRAKKKDYDDDEDDEDKIMRSFDSGDGDRFGF
ncbi:hypothetical protein [Hymenobacter sp. UYP22]|uniref:hypothetical protein n=1 Tax=Hymenobacter sp. UYP22 TaxID=3156348 RepID=UPI0033912116